MVDRYRDRRHQVAIIGSGFGGLTAAQRLSREDVAVTLIDRKSHHLFQPLLYQVATGIVSEGQIAPSTRLLFRDAKNVEVLRGEVDTIDLDGATVTSRLDGAEFVTPYDSLIVAAGSAQSYFGHDHFAEYAPGLKTVDDALEIRGRIMEAFEQAEVTEDPTEQDRLLTFVLIGAGPTGVELAGQIREMSTRTLREGFRRIDPSRARVILVDAAPTVLASFGKRLARRAARRLEQMGVEIELDAMVVDVDADGIEVAGPGGERRRIECRFKAWSAGVTASPLGRQIADQSDAETDRSGRVEVETDLTVPGRSGVYVIGDLMSVRGVPGMAQGAIQSGELVAESILSSLDRVGRGARPDFHYVDKGSMATIARFEAVAKIAVPGTGRTVDVSGFLAWIGWLVIHLTYLVGYRNRFFTLVDWLFAFTTPWRSQLVTTEWQAYGRTPEAERSSGRHRADRIGSDTHHQTGAAQPGDAERSTDRGGTR